MFGAQEKLEVSQDELAVIQAALETQAKILNVQAGAGGSGARRRLNEVTKVLSQVTRHREGKAKRRFGFGWFGSPRSAG